MTESEFMHTLAVTCCRPLASVPLPRNRSGEAPLLVVAATAPHPSCYPASIPLAHPLPVHGPLTRHLLSRLWHSQLFVAPLLALPLLVSVKNFLHPTPLSVLRVRSLESFACHHRLSSFSARTPLSHPPPAACPLARHLLLQQLIHNTSLLQNLFLQQLTNIFPAPVSSSNSPNFSPAQVSPRASSNSFSAQASSRACCFKLTTQGGASLLKRLAPR